MAGFITPVEVSPASTGWQDVDCSALIPAGSTGVMLHLVSPTTAANVGFRKNGSTDNRVAQLAAAHCWAYIGVDANRIFECNLSNTTNVDVYIYGYFGPEAVFFTNAIDKSLSATGAWTDVDISGDTGADTAIAAIFELQAGSNAYQLGFRVNGSTDDRHPASVARKGGLICGVDGSEICELYIDNASLDTFLVGYMKSGYVGSVNADEVTDTTYGAWADLAAYPTGATGALYELITYATAMGIRPNGSSEDIYLLPYHQTVAMPGDASRVVEAKKANANQHIYLRGYFSSLQTKTVRATAVAVPSAHKKLTRTFRVIAEAVFRPRGG